ncbi:MAG: dgpfaetke family protein [Gemmataceae bacterium]|nr:dgpfaetke family protein [Gemmataceae bacterium]
MQFAILIYETESDFATRKDPARHDEYMGAYTAYGKALREAGLYVVGSALQPPETGATVRLRGGERRVQDGPYADTKEQLGGFILIEAPDLETALDWAARCPAAARGSVEVRAVGGKCSS